MKTYQFTLILADVDGLDIDQADAIYAACSDATAGAAKGVVHVHFDREADTLDAAIRTAISDVQTAGYSVHHVESEEYATINRFNDELAHA